MPRGSRTTDELRAELDATEQELADARRGVWIQRAKAVAIVIGASATLITAILAHFRPETIAEETAGAAAASIRQLQAAIKSQAGSLAATRESCERISAAGAAKAKAEADTVRNLVLGFLLARRGSESRPQADLRKSLGDVVEQLGDAKAKIKPLLDVGGAADQAQKPRNWKLSAPLKLERLSKGKELK